MSKSVEILLKESLEANAAQAKALTEKVEALASEGNTYTDRMKKMEDNLHNAMTQVLGMDENIKKFHKEMEAKLCGLEAKYGAISVQKDDADMEEGEDTPETEDGDEVDAEKEAKELAPIPPPPPKGEVVEGEEGEDVEEEDEDKESEVDAEKQGRGWRDNVPAMPASTPPPRNPNKGVPSGSAENSIEGVNPSLNTVDKKTKLKKGAGAPIGKPDPKLVEKDGAEQIDEESNKKFTKGKRAQETVSDIAKQLDSKIESALQKLASVTAKPSTEVTQLNEKLALESKAKEEALNHFKALNEKFESLMAKVSSLEKSEKTIEQKAAQIVASNGVEAVAISVDTPTVATKTDADVMKEFEALSGTEQRAFYLANKQVIERHASSVLRGKRS